MTELLPTIYGEERNALQKLRQVANYSGDPVSAVDAERAVERGEAFVAAIREKFGP